jgi:hypothetical protein
MDQAHSVQSHLFALLDTWHYMTQQQAQAGSVLSGQKQQNPIMPGDVSRNAP